MLSGIFSLPKKSRNIFCHCWKSERWKRNNLSFSPISFANTGVMSIQALWELTCWTIKYRNTQFFAIDDWWISDYNSYIFQQPATLFVEALEDTILIQIDYNAEGLLKETIPKFEKFFRIITERAFAFLQQRMLSNLSKTAEERYEEFMQRYAEIAKRVPQYALASYLGMSTEYLSKLRNNRLAKKSWTISIKFPKTVHFYFFRVIVALYCQY